ncbi:hypothetical protein [Helicobacter cetorum]|uniref:hypothetical protein n=1 Tax=Helicobacter cetorum TaxID=138563 RepID=UPI001315A502|nr:hypothetical protein [Helicobacter cetorum]
MKKLSLKEPLVLFENHFVKRINGSGFPSGALQIAKPKKRERKQQSFTEKDYE